MRVLRISHSAVVTPWRARERELRAAGVEVTLLCAKVWNEGGAPVHLVADGDDFVTGVATLGRHPNLFVYDPRPIWRALRRGGFDVVDLHEEPFSLAAGELLALRLLAGVRSRLVFYSAQNLDKDYPPPFRWIEDLSLRTASGADVCNEAAGRRLRRRGLHGELKVIGLGVDVERFHPAERGAPAGPARLGYLGRLERHKGVHVLLEALARLESATLELVGGGPEAGPLAERARALGIEGRVEFVGHLSGDELAERYRRYDAVVVPSVATPGWTEQFCRVAVEAMASGVPVVASDSGALPEVVGDAGVLVAAGDPAALADALASLCSDPSRWSELRRRGLERSKRYSWSAVAAEQRALYEAVLA